MILIRHSGTTPGIKSITAIGQLTLLDVVVGKSPSIFQLLAGEDQTLLIRGDALLVLQELQKELQTKNNFERTQHP
jgi:hypothetical protein